MVKVVEGSTTKYRQLTDSSGYSIKFLTFYVSYVIININNNMRCKYMNIRKQNPKEYRAWKAMRNRCNNPNYHAYHRYGGRGINVCNRWSNFENFLNDMGKAPYKNYQLDRINNDKGYSPDNCRWVTPKENSNNRKKYKNSTGYTGVFYRKEKRRYEVNVCINRKHRHIGVFYNLEDAVNARKKFIIEYNDDNNTQLKYEEFIE